MTYATRDARLGPFRLKFIQTTFSRRQAPSFGDCYLSIVRQLFFSATFILLISVVLLLVGAEGSALRRCSLESLSHGFSLGYVRSLCDTGKSALVFLSFCKQCHTGSRFLRSIIEAIHVCAMHSQWSVPSELPKQQVPFVCKKAQKDERKDNTCVCFPCIFLFPDHGLLFPQARAV